MTNQMVSRFRVKKLSPKHPLPVYKESDLPDLNDAANLQRAVPQIETGVEKEEEEEHDLQAAISAAQAAVTTGAKIERYIPTPDASRVIAADALYTKKFKEPSQLIKFSSTVEDMIGCEYAMDEDDESFLQRHRKASSSSLSEDDFETIMWEFESITKDQLPHLNLDPTQIPDYASFMEMVPESSRLRNLAETEAVFAHWRERRLTRQGQSVFPELKFEDTLKNEIDPYVCFRRRETKPVRKTRRTDKQSLERLRKLRTEMEMARNLLEMVQRREKLRKESLELEHNVFDRRCNLREYQRELGIKEDDSLLFPTKKKRKSSLESGSSGATIKIPLHRLNKRDGTDRPEKSLVEIKLEAELAAKRERDAPFEDITECPYQPFPLSISQRFFQSFSPDKHAPRFRKRIGRGGRIFIDRLGFRPESRAHLGGKTKPSESSQRSSRHDFDSDSSDSEDDEVEVDEMEDLYMKHRARLLSKDDLRNLVAVPFSLREHPTRQY